MTTDQQILDLMKRGFVLPDGLMLVESVTPRKAYEAENMWQVGWHLAALDRTVGPDNRIADQHAHDLCVMAFARQLGSGSHRMDERLPNALHETWFHEKFGEAMNRGDSAAAIDALWRATGGK